MFKKFIALFVMAVVTFQLCDIGCSKCDKSSNQCVVCDTRSNYFLQNGNCFKLIIDNCSTYTQNGNCLQCSKDYYLDSNTNSCAPLAEADKINNCKYYNALKACVSCEEGFIVLGVSCGSVSSSVANCDSYSSDLTCLKCKSGYIFSNDRLACIEKPTVVSSCAGYSPIRCVQCANGFYQNPNLYINSFYNQINNSFFAQTSEILDNGSLAEWTSYPVCQKVLDPNCFVADSLTTCQTCKAGYFINSGGHCEPILNSLPNCFTKQTTNNDCIVCSSAYYPNESKICVLRTVFTCLTYDPTADRCASCTLNRYLDTNKICQLRSVTTCLTYNLNSDTCLSCSVSLHFMNSSSICQARVNTNCLTFSITNDYCLSCPVSSFYFNSSNLCITRTITNCLTFNPNADNCLSCTVNLYYYNNNLCNARNVRTCDTYSPTTDICLTCNQSLYWMNTSTNVCVARAYVNCSSFNPTADKCITCPSNRYLTVNFDCLSRIKTNCAATVINADQCTSCNSGYYLNNGDCPLNTAANCLTKSTASNFCVNCITTAYLDSADGLCKAYTVTNCASFSSSSNACLSCLTDYYLSSNNCVLNTSSNCLVKSSSSNTCTTCVNNTYRDGSNNCQLYTVNNCATRSTSSNACLTCNTGYYLNSNDCLLNDSTNCQTKSQSSNTCVTCNTGYYAQTSHDCALISITNCKVHHTTLNRCVTCNDFYYVDGTYTCTANPDAVLHCIVYISDTTCSKCSDLYLLVSPTSCVPIAENQKILNCLTYRNDISTIQCTRCINGYYVNNNICSTRVLSANIENCSALNLFADRCLTCAAGYRLTDDNLACLSVIANCKAYASSTVASLNLMCTSCNDGYYLQNSSTCLVGDSSYNCLAFGNLTDCLSCQPNYYLFGAYCFAQTATIPNCSVLSTTTINECTTCNAGFHPFKIFSGCQAATPVLNCATYNNSATCITCASTHYLNDSNGCSILPGNCKRATTLGQCSECMSGYLLNTLYECFPVFQYITTNCDTINDNVSYNIAQENSDTCKVCSSGAIRQSIGGAAMCIQNAVASYLDINGGAIISNCKKYSNSNTRICIECNTGYHLSDMKANNPSCVDNATPCTSSQVLLLDNLNGKIFGCISLTANMNCKVAVRIQLGGDDPNNFACLQVQTSYIPVITLFSADVSTVAYEYNSANTYADWNMSPSNLLYKGPQVKAVSATNNKHTTGTCELYFERSGFYVCYKAAFGSAVTFSGSGNTATSSAAAIADCNTSVKYSGIPSYLTAVLSCHSCTTSTKSPFVYIQLNDSSSSFWSGIKSATPSVTCEIPGSTITNCAVYGKLYDISGSPSSVCLSCMPGYKPSSVSDNKSIASCDAIDNCDLNATENTVANKCGKCLATNANGKPLAFASSDLLSCVPTSYDNCFIATSTLNASNVYDCARCQFGYFLNADKKCEPLTLAGCSETSSTIFGSVTSANLIEYYLLKYKAGKEINGCNACTTADDLIVKVHSNEKQCVTSTYVTGNSYIASTVYISNCSKYNNYYSDSNTPAFKCNACLPGFTVTNDNLKCVTAIANCALASSTTNTKCATCSTNYINVNGQCLSPAITNCATYADTSSLNSQICNQCNSGYSKTSSGASCVIGTVANCKTYTDDSTTDCTACISDYGLMKLPNNVRICINIKTSTNCVEANTVSFNLSGLYCTKCFVASDNSAVYAITEKESLNNYPNTPLSICIPHLTTTNCASYDGNNLSMNANTFNCLTCNAGTLFVRATDNTCVTRTTRNNCSTYTSGVDTCSTCNPNYWLSADGTTCNAYPPFILNCRKYSNASTCEECEPNYYLNINSCLPVNNIVANCLRYSDATTCNSCQPQYHFKNNSCIKIVASNCVTTTEYNQCATCAPGSGLKPGIGSQIDCVVLNLQFCSVTTNSWPYCNSCLVNYFFDPNTSFCIAPPTPIANCVTYASLTTCSSCTYPKFPSPTGTSCDTPNVPNCATFSGLTTCSLCTLPYFVNPSNTCSIPNISGCATYSGYNVCTSCSNTNYFPSANGSSCVLANSIPNCQTYSNSTTCQACQTNYWLELGVCNLQQNIADCITWASSTTCATCVAGKFPVGSLCSVPTSIPNCSFYDTKTTCQTCLSGYFLAADKLSCTLIIVVPNCATYSSPTVCSACNSGYMKTGNTCPQIVAIANCSTWSAYNTCSQCLSGFMLTNNACPQIVAIANCSTWSAYNTCSQCLTGFMLTNNACPQIVAIPYCTQWSAYNTCSQCALGRMLYNNTCPLIVAISGCNTWSAYNTCSACNANLFLYQNSCTSGFVSNCLVHDSPFTCTNCYPGFVLSIDRKSCSATYAFFIDLNCNNSQLLSEAFCTICSPGYYFAGDGTCTSCLYNSFTDGCLSCDPNNQSACFICKSGFYQNVDGNCVAYSQIGPHSEQASGNPSSPNTPINANNTTRSDNTTVTNATTNSTNLNATNTTNSTNTTNTTNATNGTNTTNSTANQTSSNDTSKQSDNSPVKSALIPEAIKLMSFFLMLLALQL